MANLEHPHAGPRLAIRQASKTFGRVRVLDSVSLEVAPGEVHGLVGQNGSGKSTLIKLLSGFYTADEGTLFEIDGEPLPMPIRARDLQARGIAFVHQNLGLDLDANVIENVRIGRFDAHPVTRRIRWRSEAESVSRTLTSLGAGEINPYAPVSALTHAQRASVAIARAIQGIEPGQGCIVFDESTQSLPRDILHEFYAQVRALAASGTAVLIVSHRLDEVLALCDRVTVLEDGVATVSNHATEGLTEAALTRLILGNSHTDRTGSIDKTPVSLGDEVLGAADIITRQLRGLSLSVRSGEVVGVIGTSDSGFDEVPYVLSGARAGLSGVVTIAGVAFPAARLNPSSAIAAGACLVPGDRAGEGLATDLAAIENLTLPRLRKSGSMFSLRRRWQLVEFDSAVESLGVTPAMPDLVAGSYSGGNQQKILLAKWLLNGPRALVLHEPTQAVDVGAREDILRSIRRQAEAGVGVLIASIETEDLASVCDRVLIVKDGVVARELVGKDIEPHTIIDAVYAGVSKEIAHVAA